MFRRGDHADIGRLLPTRPDPAVRPVLQNAEQADLRLEREFADLVEEDRPAVRLFEVARAPLDAAGVRPFLRPEQLGLDQPFGDRAAVDDDERLVPAAAERVDEIREQLLPDAALTFEEYGDVGAGNLARAVKHAPEFGRVADDAETFLNSLPVHVPSNGERASNRVREVRRARKARYARPRHGLPP